MIRILNNGLGDDHPTLYGTCVADEKSDRTLEVRYGEANSAAECIAGCRSLTNMDGFLGFDYAGLEYQNECWCGDGPDDFEYADFTRCNMRCQGERAFWQNCGGFGVMNAWSVPKSEDTDLGGICVYDFARDGRVFNGASVTGVEDLTPWSCKDYCSDRGHGSIKF